MTPTHIDIEKLRELHRKWERSFGPSTARCAAEAMEQLPSLILMAEQVERLEAALRKHGKHDGLCARIGGYGYCTCGLEAELDALSPTTTEDQHG